MANKRLTEQQLEALPEPIQQMFRQLETDIITTISKRIGDVGKLSPADVYKLKNLQDIGFDLEVIQKETANTVIKSEKEIYDIFYESAKFEYDGNKVFYDLTGAEFIPFEKNKEALALVESISKATYGEFVNYASTTGFMGYIKQNGPQQFVHLPKSVYMPLDEYYQTTIDYAVMQVRNGTETFHKTMRKTVNELADNGLISNVYYDNAGKQPYRRRLDSSVRNAFMGGQSRLSMQLADLQGEEFGADAYEISFHGGFRPSHDFGGKRFSKEDWERYIRELMEEANCYHRKYPIIMGLSTPAYSSSQLAKLNEEENKLYTFEGRQYNKYDATQQQRRFETAIRKQKDRAAAFGASGDTEAESWAINKSALLNRKYKEFSSAVHLQTQPERLTIGKFTRSQASRQGWAGRKLAIDEQKAYNKAKEELANIPKKIRQGQQNKHIVGTKEYKEKALRLKEKGQYGPSYLFEDVNVKNLVDKYSGTGILEFSRTGKWKNQETILSNNSTVGVAVNNLTGKEAPTTVFKIHYSNHGYHIVPDYPSKKGGNQ